MPKPVWEKELTLLLWPKGFGCKLGADFLKGLFRALVTLQYGLQQDVCMFLAVGDTNKFICMFAGMPSP